MTKRVVDGSSPSASEPSARAGDASGAIAALINLGISPGPIKTELSTPVPYPDKATPEHAAINIVKGIGAAQTYIFPDPMAQQAEQLWSTDNRKLEYRSLHLGA